MKPEAFVEQGLMRDVIIVGVEGRVVTVARETRYREPGAILHALNIARGRCSPPPPERFRAGVLRPRGKTRAEFIEEMIRGADADPILYATSGTGWPD